MIRPAGIRRRARVGAVSVLPALLVAASLMGAMCRVEPGAHTRKTAPAVEIPRAPIADVPVLLVPGWFDSARDLADIRIHLLGAGWSDEQVRTLTFDEPTGSNRDHADELAAEIDDLLAETGADEVDVVAHSMGGLATRWYLLTRPEAPVRRVVFLGSPHRGTLSAHLAWGGGRDEMMPDSPFLDSLNSAQPAPEGVDAVTVRTLIDTHIVPGTSATLPGVPDYALCCPTHAGLLKSTDVFDIVRSFLELGAVARQPTNGIRPRGSE